MLFDISADDEEGHNICKTTRCVRFAVASSRLDTFLRNTSNVTEHQTRSGEGFASFGDTASIPDELAHIFSLTTLSNESKINSADFNDESEAASREDAGDDAELAFSPSSLQEVNHDKSLEDSVENALSRKGSTPMDEAGKRAQSSVADQSDVQPATCSSLAQKSDATVDSSISQQDDVGLPEDQLSKEALNDMSDEGQIQPTSAERKTEPLIMQTDDADINIDEITEAQPARVINANPLPSNSDVHDYEFEVAALAKLACRAWNSMLQRRQHVRRTKANQETNTPSSVRSRADSLARKVSSRLSSLQCFTDLRNASS